MVLGERSEVTHFLSKVKVKVTKVIKVKENNVAPYIKAYAEHISDLKVKTN